jgi:hypothetical protein
MRNTDDIRWAEAKRIMRSSPAFRSQGRFTFYRVEISATMECGHMQRRQQCTAQRLWRYPRLLAPSRRFRQVCQAAALGAFAGGRAGSVRVMAVAGIFPVTFAWL